MVPFYFSSSAKFIPCWEKEKRKKGAQPPVTHFPPRAVSGRQGSFKQQNVRHVCGVERARYSGRRAPRGDRICGPAGKWPKGDDFGFRRVAKKVVRSGSVSHEPDDAESPRTRRLSRRPGRRARGSCARGAGDTRAPTVVFPPRARARAAGDGSTVSSSSRVDDSVRVGGQQKRQRPRGGGENARRGDHGRKGSEQ